jgi:hypothetical protein
MWSNNEKGFVYLEIITCFTIFSLVFLLHLSAIQLLIAQSKLSAAEWDRIWQVKVAMAKWKAGYPSAELSSTLPFQLSLEEKWISHSVQEGVFRVTWEQKTEVKTKVFYAYRMGSP